jgi:hypothetical protein
MNVGSTPKRWVFFRRVNGVHFAARELRECRERPRTAFANRADLTTKNELQIRNGSPEKSEKEKQMLSE